MIEGELMPANRLASMEHLRSELEWVRLIAQGEGADVLTKSKKSRLK